MNQSQASQPEPETVMTEKEMKRFMGDLTWKYGKDGRNVVFINDNTLTNTVHNGIAAILCHRIGNEKAERLAALWIAAPNLLLALEQLTPPECPIITHHSPTCAFCFALRAIAEARGQKTV